MAAPPGPINALIMNESLKSPLHGTSVGFGAMSADFIFFLLVFYFRFAIPHIVYTFLYFFAAILLVYMALSLRNTKITNRSEQGNYFIGLILGLSNPFQIAWWLSVGIFMINTFPLITSITFFSGIITWIFIFPFIIKRKFERYEKYIKIFSMSILWIFAIIIIIYGILNL